MDEFYEGPEKVENTHHRDNGRLLSVNIMYILMIVIFGTLFTYIVLAFVDPKTASSGIVTTLVFTIITGAVMSLFIIAFGEQII